VPFNATTISTPVTFRQSATDADNHLDTIVAAGYAQDQVELSSQVSVVSRRPLRSPSISPITTTARAMS